MWSQAFSGGPDPPPRFPGVRARAGVSFLERPERRSPRPVQGRTCPPGCWVGHFPAGLGLPSGRPGGTPAWEAVADQATWRVGRRPSPWREASGRGPRPGRGPPHPRARGTWPLAKWPPRRRGPSRPRTPRGRGRAPRPGPGQPRGPGVPVGRAAGRREPGGRGPGRGTKGPFVERGREKRARITQCPGAMLVTREPFSASLENNSERRGAGRDLTPWARGGEGALAGPGPRAGRLPVSRPARRSRSPNMAAWPGPGPFGAQDWAHGLCCGGLLTRAAPAAISRPPSPQPRAEPLESFHLMASGPRLLPTATQAPRGSFCPQGTHFPLRKPLPSLHSLVCWKVYRKI